MKWKTVLITAISILVSTASAAGSTLGPYSVAVTSAKQVDDHGTQFSLTRWYRLYVPSSLTSPAPLVIVLHGGNANYSEVINSLITIPTTIWATTPFTYWQSPYPSDTSNQSIADKFGILVAVPNGINGSSTNYPGSSSDPGDARYGTGQHWNDCSGVNPGFPLSSTTGNWAQTSPRYNVDDVAFLSKVISDVESRYTVDTKNIFVAGASNGSNMALRMARELPGTIGAVAASLAGDGAGFYQSPTPNPLVVQDTCQNASFQSTSSRVPIYLLKGDQDSFITYNGACNAPGASKANGCWLPYSPSPTSGTNLPSGGVTTIGRVLTRYGYGSSPTTAAASAYYNQNNVLDNGSTISCTYYYYSGTVGVLSRSDIESCTALNAGHDDPSINQHMSSGAQSTFGNQNWDIEAAVEEWMFFKNHPRP